MSKKEVGYVWIESTDKKTKRIGLSRQGLERIGQIVWFSTPPAGASVDTNTTLFILESSKAAIELESPITGTVAHGKECTEECITALNLNPDQEWLVELDI